MDWFFFALAAPALWGIVNHIDKYIINKYYKGSGLGSLVVYTSISGAVLAIFIALFNFGAIRIPVIDAVVIAISGAILIAAFIPYMHAMEEEDPAVVVALFQLIPVFTYLLALIFLKEQLTTSQLLASGLIILGALIISLETAGKIRFKLKSFFLMVLSSGMIALDNLLFKVIALDATFWGTVFWGYIGGAIFGLVLLGVIKHYRVEFVRIIRENKLSVLNLNFFSEIIYNIGRLSASYSSLLAPLALGRVVASSQPLMVFIYGLLLTAFFPKLAHDKLKRHQIVQQLLAIGLILVGMYFLLQ